MQDQLKAIREHVIEELKSVQDSNALEQLRVRVLGKQGELTAILRGMGKVPAEERPAIGRIVNETREKLESAIDETAAALRARQRRAHVPRSGKSGRSLEGDELAGGARLLLKRANFVCIRERDGLPAAFLRRRARRLLRKQLQHLIKL